MHPIIEAMKARTPIVISPMGGDRKTAVGSSVFPGPVLHEQPTGSAMFNKTVVAHCWMQYVSSSS